MAVRANSIETYEVSTIREDLSQAYVMISPEECPLQNMAGSRSVSQKQFDWTVVSLATPDGANRVIEGDVDVANDAPTLARRLVNICQISDKIAEVSHTTQASDGAADNIQRLDIQVALKMKEMKRDTERMLLSNVAANLGATATARVTAGLPAFLRTNRVLRAGATAPTLSIPGTSEGYPNAGWVDATTPVVFAELDFNNVLEQCWNAGAEPSVMMLNGGNKRRVSSAFTGYATRYKDAMDRTLQASIDFYDSDFGDITIVPNRFQPTLNAATDNDNFAVYILDPNYIKIAELDPVQRKPLAETGHSIRALIWREYGLQVDNEAAHGIIPDTTNALT